MPEKVIEDTPIEDIPVEEVPVEDTPIEEISKSCADCSGTGLVPFKETEWQRCPLCKGTGKVK